MNKNQNDILYTGLNTKQIKKAYRNKLKKSWLSKNILPRKNYKKSWDEKLIKFFIKIILWIATPRASWKNKSKTSELINRTYLKFSGRDFTFIPISLAFYFLISFVPIITIVVMLLSLISNYNQIFIDEILARIIPGVKAIMNIPDSIKQSKAQYTSIILLMLASIWIASSGFGKFIYSQNYIYGHENLGNWLTNRIKGFIVVIGISIYLFLFISLYIFFHKAFSYSINEKFTKNTIFYISFSIYLIINLYFGFTLMFKLTPSFKLSWNMVFPGVLISSIPVMIFIMLFGYLTSIIDYNKYGVIGTFMYIAMFVSTLSYFMYLGIIVNEAYYKTYFSSYTIAKRDWMFKKIKF
ncbi:YihY/virulence factor BrkB family protein [Mycoplasmopsis lipofaciens]|uniref:YihY/virulence factor BrkB family protein n=1 Tax=Mycoplasmopsis lipofaciens TaxID=114884 RepID=UPI000486D4B3|nr:YihY/virulence factor BrkB family protein [Mycoplasmopsis lipofaciens]